MWISESCACLTHNSQTCNAQDLYLTMIKQYSTSASGVGKGYSPGIPDGQSAPCRESNM